MSKDIELRGNEGIEEAVAAFIGDRTEEKLAALLGAIRAQMNKGASFVVAVEPSDAGMRIKEVVLKDGRTCSLVFTSFEEQMKGTKTISTFMGSIRQLLDGVINSDGLDGLLLNAYGKAFVIDKRLAKVIVG